MEITRRERRAKISDGTAEGEVDAEVDGMEMSIVSASSYLIIIEVSGFVVPFVMGWNDGKVKLSESGSERYIIFCGEMTTLRQLPKFPDGQQGGKLMARSGAVLYRTQYITYL